ncbi:MAG: hypothetical protein J7K48_04665 [Thermococcus sp.]|nr:hypothetical protein [Thermococcus sp.]
MAETVRFIWPVDREFVVSDFPNDYLELKAAGLVEFLGLDEWRARILAAYQVATNWGITGIAKLTPRWIGRKSKYFEYSGGGEPTTYAEFKVPDGVVMLLLGFITEDGPVDEVLIDLENWRTKDTILIPVAPRKIKEGRTLYQTLTMLFVPGDEVRIKLVTYDPDNLEDVIMPFGIVFYSPVGLNQIYKRAEGGEDGGDS